MQTKNDFIHDLKWSTLSVTDTATIDTVYDSVQTSSYATYQALDNDFQILYADVSLLECIAIVADVTTLDELFNCITNEMQGAIYYLGDDSMYAVAV